MILESRIWQETIGAAKAAAFSSPAWLRAIDRAVAQIETNPCITELASGVLITSPSGRTYLANGVCQCAAYKHKMACWHRAIAQLLTRYDEALSAPATPKPADERDRLIDGIKATWSRKYPGEYLADELMARFGCNNLEMLNTDFLRRIQGALEGK